jgi:succinate dehydrogenase/fumarate reductase flavoprotein subunit
MKKNKIKILGKEIDVFSLNTVVVGSGASGLNAADRLYNLGQKDIAIVTEGINMGTSRNTGSDKQTYYKLSLAGGESDSVREMAETLFSGGSMDGDIALVEAALSTEAFFHLIDIGVPFPHNRYGEYIGYKTDHDPRKRATSAGPLTSRYMTEKLEAEVKKKDITIFDNYQVIGILTDKKQSRTLGLLTLDKNNLNTNDNIYTIFNTENIIYAVGGPAGLYKTSVYPESQTGASGLAFEAGVMGKNLTEWQYGIASTKVRWNLSGTYQQVLPRYISTDKNGDDQREFLADYFKDPSKMLNAVFLKGYQWPFDPSKVKNNGSSIIDILVFNESVKKDRKVWLDFSRNSQFASDDKGNIDFSLLNDEAYKYLEQSEVLFGTPIERLKYMNNEAYKLYLNNGIDLESQLLEIAVCAQHNNGGLEGGIWWESNIKHFFPVGETNGSHGVYRPGGTALNSGQVGSKRAAQFIAKNYTSSPSSIDRFLQETQKQIEEKINLGDKFILSIISKNNSKQHERESGKDYAKRNVLEIREDIGSRMTSAAGHIRSLEKINTALTKTKEELGKLTQITKLESRYDLSAAFQNYDLLIAQYVYLYAFKDYIQNGGESRGSYIIKRENGEIELEGLAEKYSFSLNRGHFKDKIQRIKYEDGHLRFIWEKVNTIPENNNWFEKIWNDFQNDNIINI